jgi:hypothetical protein
MLADAKFSWDFLAEIQVKNVNSAPQVVVNSMIDKHGGLTYISLNTRYR